MLRVLKLQEVSGPTKHGPQYGRFVDQNGQRFESMLGFGRSYLKAECRVHETWEIDCEDQIKHADVQVFHIVACVRKVADDPMGPPQSTDPVFGPAAKLTINNTLR